MIRRAWGRLTPDDRASLLLIVVCVAVWVFVAVMVAVLP